MAKKVRVLVDTRIEGIDYKIDQVVELPDGVAKAYAKEGVVDIAPEAVSYVLGLGAEVIVHTEVIEAQAVVVDPAPAAGDAPVADANPAA